MMKFTHHCNLHVLVYIPSESELLVTCTLGNINIAVSTVNTGECRLDIGGTELFLAFSLKNVNYHCHYHIHILNYQNVNHHLKYSAGNRQKNDS